MIASFFRNRKKRRKLGEQLYSFIREGARNADFFGDDKIPDTIDGRFEVLIIHGFLLMQAVRLAEPRQRLDQLIFDAMFRDLDSAVRHMGTSDTRVGRQMKAMAKAFYGRSESYLEALESAELAKISLAVKRNALINAPDNTAFADGLAKWLLASHNALAKQDIEQLITDSPAFASTNVLSEK